MKLDEVIEQGFAALVVASMIFQVIIWIGGFK